MAVALTGLVITALVALWMWDTAKDERLRQLETHGQVLADSIGGALNEVVERLAGLASFHRASDEVSVESFRSYTENLPPIAGMRGLGFIPIVVPQQLADHEAEISESIPGYRVFQIEDGQRVPTSLRRFHAPVQWFEPADDPARPHGFDTASEPLRREAIRRAMDNGGVSVTGFTALVDEGPGDAFIVYLPITDRTSDRIVAFTVAPMELGALLDSQISTSLAAQIDWHIENVTSGVEPPIPTPNRWSTVMDVGNNWWQLTVTWDEESQHPLDLSDLALVAISGVSVSLLAAAGFFQHRRKRETQKELDELRSLSRAKDQFLASVSHELRTPLTGVLGFAELLREEQTDLSEAERRSMISKVAEEATDLASIIDDLLVAARSELDLLAITRVPVSLTAQVAQVVESFSESLRSSVEMIGTTQRRATGDPGRTRQIIRNLISNADRYGGDRIEIRFGSDEKVAWLEVADNGPGLPPSEWERIFEPYYRAHENRGGQPGALGIGLSVARHLARLMDGDLRYGRASGWSVFTLTLPASNTITAPSQALEEVGS